MDLGISITSGLGGEPAAAVSTVVNRVRAAADAGLAHLTFGDHHAVGPNGQYFQGVPMLGRATAEWPSERAAGLLFLVPLWHPVLMAEQIGTLAALHDGPFVVQTGIGGGGADFAAFGVDPTARGRLIDAAIPLVKALLAGETVSDERFGIVDAAIGPRPGHGVEWWIGAGSANAAIDRAAREGDAWYIGPQPTTDDVRGPVEFYRERCAHYGTEPRLIVRFDVVVGDDDLAAVTTGDRLFADGYRGMPRESIIAGGVDRVAALLAPWAEIGATDIVARNAAIPFADAERSTELLGDVRRQLLDV